MHWPWSRAPADDTAPPRSGAKGGATNGERTVCLFLDDSPAAERAWRWAAANLIDPKRDRCEPAAEESAAASPTDAMMHARSRSPSSSPNSVHMVAVATPPAFAGDNMPGSDPELDISVAAGACRGRITHDDALSWMSLFCVTLLRPCWCAEDLSCAGRTLADASAQRYAAQLEHFKTEAPRLLGVRAHP
jgi:hypothetical protein